MKYLLLSIFLFSLVQSSGQYIRQTERIELPFRYSDENYIMAPAGAQGIVLFRESKKRVNKKYAWEVLVLDSVLTEKQKFDIEVAYKYTIMGYQYHEGDLYLLFGDNNTAQTDFLLIKASIETGQMEQHSIDNELIMDPTHLLINDQSVVLGGYINYRPTFMIFDYIDDKVYVVPGFFSTRSEILSFRYDEKHKLYNVLMGQKNTTNRNEVAIKSFNETGKVLLDEKHTFEDNVRALNGAVMISESDHIIISGSYADNNSYYSKGYYFGKLHAGGKLKVKYTSFPEVEHFFDYMNPKRATKMKKKARNALKNNTTFEFKTQAYVHELVEKDEQFILVSELYKPEFQQTVSPGSVRYSDATANNNYRSRTGQKYVHRASKLTNTQGASNILYYESVVIGFDQNGNMLWDQSMSLDKAETLALEQVAVLNKKDDYLTMLFKNKNEISYKSFFLTTDTCIIDSTQAIDTFDELDQVEPVSDYQGKLQHWYDDNFIVWGYQKIQNEANSEKKRNVFFINKIQIE